MIKSKFEIKVSDFYLMETTGKIDQFKKWYNIFPTKLFIKRISILVDELTNLLNKGEFKELDIQILEYEIKKFFEVNELMAYDTLLTSVFTAQARLLVIKSSIKLNRLFRRKLNKITDKPEILRFCCEKIKLLTGIEINQPADVIMFKDKLNAKIERLNDYLNRKHQKEETDKKIELNTIIYTLMSYLNFLEMSISNVDDVRIVHFVEIRKLADEKMKQITAQLNEKH